MRYHVALALCALPARMLIGQAPAPIRFELPNGLRVWVQEDHTRPIALVQVAYKVGAINEAPGATGTAHYVEHMVYRATEHIRNEDIYGYIDRIGGRYTGGTSRDGTTYGETVPRWALEAALRTTAERMRRARFDSVEFERERNNVVTEANGFSRNDPATALRDAVMLTSFELHPYRYSSNSWSQDNLSITRDDAFEFYKRYYGPNNAVLTVVGDVSVDEARRLVAKHFGPLARAPRSGAVTVVEPPQRAEKRLTIHGPAARAQLEIVFRAPQAGHPDYPILVAVDQVLNRRLQAALPAVGAADITTSHTATPYPFVFRIAATAGRADDLERIVAAIQSAIESLGKEGVTAGELATARTDVVPQGRGRGGGGTGGTTQAQGGVPPRQSNLTQIANQLTSRETFSWEVGADLRDQIRRKAENVTAGDIQGYVDRWLRTSQRTVGFLVPGADDFMPIWSNARPLAGDRLEIPPLTTTPAKRIRPEPVQPQSLEPLAALHLRAQRRVLANGLVVRAARNSAPGVAIAARVTFGTAADSDRTGLPLLAARLVASDSALQALNARVTTGALANDGFFDLRFNITRDELGPALAALARALMQPAFASERVAAEAARVDAPVGRGGGGGGGGRGAAVAAEARTRVLRVVAPRWVPEGGSASLSRFTANDVRDFLTRHLAGSAVAIGVVSNDEPSRLIDVVAAAVSALPKGEPPQSAGRAASEATSPAPQDDRVPAASETQLTVAVGLPGVARDAPERRALELLNYIVGVPSYGGRLGWALTKAGLTYSSAATTTFGASTGHILFSTKCDTRNLDATIQAIREVIAGVGQRGVDAWEVREAKAFTLGRLLLYGTRDDSGPDAIAAALVESETSGDELLDLPALSRAYLAVTPEQVNAAARRYYRADRLKVVAIGALPRGAAPQIFPAGTFRALFEP